MLSNPAIASFPIGSIDPILQWGTVAGHVKTSNGDPIPSCAITIYDSTGSTEIGHTTTDANGYYNTSMPYGDYAVAASRDDVGISQGEALTVSGTPATIDLAIISKPAHLKLEASKGYIQADGSDKVKLTVTVRDAFFHPPGESWTVKVKLDTPTSDISSTGSFNGHENIFLDSTWSVNGVTTTDFGVISPKTAVTSITISASISTELSDQVTLDIHKATASPSPSPSPSPLPSPSPSPSPNPQGAVNTGAAYSTAGGTSETPDVIAPATSLNLTGIHDASGVFTSNVVCTLTATDEGGSGVNRTEYSFDGGNWTLYAGSFTVSSPGNTSIFYRSADRAGNQELTRAEAITIAGSASAAAGGQKSSGCLPALLLPLLAAGIVGLYGMRKAW